LKVPKPILITAKLLEMISPKLATSFAIKLFITPLKHTIPKRELHMETTSKQTFINLPTLNKKIVVYEYGESTKKILLVHGWSGRGTQLVKIADELVKTGFSTVSFDAPAHGKSSGKSTIMTEFITSILVLEKKFGPFDAAIGHSLGGMALLNAVKNNLQIKRLVIIGSGDKVPDIVDSFVAKLELQPKISNLMQNRFEKKYGVKMNAFDASFAAKEVVIPTLVIHDENDNEIPLSASKNIFQNLINGQLLITKDLGHRKILGDISVIKSTLQFLTQ
jgi:pimeloyl-ACP methyl ester carboxylesterase